MVVTSTLLVLAHGSKIKRSPQAMLEVKYGTNVIISRLFPLFCRRNLSQESPNDWSFREKS